MRARKSAANFQLLADDQVVARAGDLQTIDPSRRSARKRLQLTDRAEVNADARRDQLSELRGGVFDAPPIEVARLLVESRQQLREKLCVIGVAVCRRSRA